MNPANAVWWPHPWRQESDWLRFTHRDLGHLGAEALWRERQRTETALAELSAADADVILDATGPAVTRGAWLRDRLVHITKEEVRRGRA